MTRKKTAEAKKPSTVVVADSADMKGALKTIGGSRSTIGNNLLANQAVQPLLAKELRSGDRNSAPLLRGPLGRGMGPVLRIERSSEKAWLFN